MSWKNKEDDNKYSSEYIFPFQLTNIPRLQSMFPRLKLPDFDCHVICIASPAVSSTILHTMALQIIVEWAEV